MTADVKPHLRIAIADDHALFRAGLKSVLKLRQDMTVVAEADRVEDIAPMLARTPCDVLLLDLQLNRNVLDDIAELAARVAVVVVTTNEHPADALVAIRNGARAVVYKRFAPETLIEALHTVAQGQIWVPPGLQPDIPFARQRPAPVLSGREREIARYVALGLRNAEVARRLFISEPTVKTHLNNVFQKLGIRDRVELTLYAVRVGIIAPHEQAT